MKAVIVPVGEMPKVVELDGSLRSLQEVVGGNIELCSWLFDDEPVVYVNDAGKFACEPNRAVYATEADAGKVRWDGSAIEEGDLLDILFGNFVCVGYDPETGEDRDVTDDEVERVRERFGTLRSLDSGWMEALAIKLQARATRP